MKKILSKLSNSLMSKSELKAIKGGYGGNCTVDCMEGNCRVGQVSVGDCNDLQCECTNAFPGSLAGECGCWD